MSIEARQAIVNHPHTHFQKDLQKRDILNPNIVKTQTIAFIQHILAQGWLIEFTACCSDHHDDTPIGALTPYPGTHFHGWAFDCWPLNTMNSGAANYYMDAGDPRFQKFLSQAMHGPYYMQTGLGGSSDTELNQIAAGPAWFPDSAEDHVHFGCKP